VVALGATGQQVKQLLLVEVVAVVVLHHLVVMVEQIDTKEPKVLVGLVAMVQFQIYQQEVI
jgi:hypothetical protein